MFRQRLSDSGGQNFLAKFRNGLQTLDAELKKLEHIVSEAEKPVNGGQPLSCASYFNDEIVFLENIDTVFVSLHLDQEC